MTEITKLDELEFKTTTQVELFAKWYLRKSIYEVQEEFASEDERIQFEERRVRRLKAEVDQLHGLRLTQGVAHSLDQDFYHIGAHTENHPMSATIDSNKNTRFNFKEVELFRNHVLYFGANRRTCYMEKFHLPIMRQDYAQLMKRTPEQVAAELPQRRHKIWRYRVKLKNVLVLTTDTTLKAAGISASVVKNEWYSVNVEFAIPTASQILASIAREKGFSGILYASVRNQTKSNLVVFLDNISGPFDCLDGADFDPSTENEEA